MRPENGIRLTDASLKQVVDKKLDLPFAVLNYDIANEPRLHKVGCTYVAGWMRPDSKRGNRTGSHWLVLENEVARNVTRSCNGNGCWKK